MGIRKSREVRFHSKVGVCDENGCAPWGGGRDPAGYGQFYWGPGKMRSVKAHRARWMLEHGDIPEGKCVCHTCDNPWCVNIEHLWLGTHAENLQDASRKGRMAGGTKIGGFWRQFTDEQIIEIRTKYRDGGTMRGLAKEYGVSQPAITNIVNHVVYKHVPGVPYTLEASPRVYENLDNFIRRMFRGGISRNDLVERYGDEMISSILGAPPETAEIELVVVKEAQKPRESAPPEHPKKRLTRSEISGIIGRNA